MRTTAQAPTRPATILIAATIRVCLMLSWQAIGGVLIASGLSAQAQPILLTPPQASPASKPENLRPSPTTLPGAGQARKKAVSPSASSLPVQRENDRRRQQQAGKSRGSETAGKAELPASSRQSKSSRAVKNAGKPLPRKAVTEGAPASNRDPGGARATETPRSTPAPDATPGEAGRPNASAPRPKPQVCTEEQFIASTHFTEQVDTLVKKFCMGNVKNIEAAMIRREKNELERVKEEVLQSLETLEVKTGEFVQLRERIEQDNKMANEQVLKIFSDMKPEAAASQLGSMDQAKARAVLARLNSKVASAILNEMQASKAAALAEGLLDRRKP